MIDKPKNSFLQNGAGNSLELTHIRSSDEDITEKPCQFSMDPRCLAGFWWMNTERSCPRRCHCSSDTQGRMMIYLLHEHQQSGLSTNTSPVTGADWTEDAPTNQLWQWVPEHHPGKNNARWVICVPSSPSSKHSPKFPSEVQQIYALLSQARVPYLFKNISEEGSIDYGVEKLCICLIPAPYLEKPWKLIILWNTFGMQSLRGLNHVTRLETTFERCFFSYSFNSHAKRCFANQTFRLLTVDASMQVSEFSLDIRSSARKY